MTPNTHIDLSTLEQLRDEIPDTTDPVIKEAWVNYMNARIEKMKHDGREK